MPDRKRMIDPVDESSARLRLFMDSESMGDLAAVDPDPDLEQVRPDPVEPQRFARRSRISLR